MAEVIIHACLKRHWYVKDYLIPSLVEQGIKRDNITVWLDKKEHGNLASWVACCKAYGDKPGGMWHLQDDVLIARDFATKVNEYDDGVVCGFCHEPYETEGIHHIGYVRSFLMWQSSFLCIRIPNEVLGHFYRWYHEIAVHDENMQKYIKTGKCDDTIFRIFMCTQRSTDTVLNLAPHLVEHVDFAVGGSVVNKWRGYTSNGAYFYDDDLVDDLVQKIAKRRANKPAF